MHKQEQAQKQKKKEKKHNLQTTNPTKQKKKTKTRTKNSTKHKTINFKKILKKQEHLKIEKNREQSRGVIMSMSKVDPRKSLDSFYK